MAHVTDYDVWHEEPVSAEMVMQTMQHNKKAAQEAIRQLAGAFSVEQSCDCEHALANAFMADPKQTSKDTRQRLGILIDKYSKSE